MLKFKIIVKQEGRLGLIENWVKLNETDSINTNIQM